MKPLLSLPQWTSELVSQVRSHRLTQNTPFVVAIAGASASGKSELVQYATLALVEQGYRVFELSLDHFYKGVSRMMCEALSPLIGPSELSDFLLFLHERLAEKTVQEKWSDRIQIEVRNFCESRFDSATTKSIMLALTEAYRHLNFDTPNAIDFVRLAATLQALRDQQSITLPSYSMTYSESGDGRLVDGSEFDVILCEGIFALHPSLHALCDLKTYVETDTRTLLLRRLRRDIFLGRKKDTPEHVLHAILTTVLPAYHTHILPTKIYADMILSNPYTELETFATDFYDVQDKIPLRFDEIDQIRSELGEPLETVFQEDYFLTNELPDQDRQHVLRIRLTDGVLESLVQKGTQLTRADGKIVRPTETYLESGDFGTYYSSITSLLTDLQKVGFRIEAHLTKKRETYRFALIHIHIDTVFELGTFMELSTNNHLSFAPEIDAFKKSFGLVGRPAVGPYIDEYRSQWVSKTTTSAQSPMFHLLLERDYQDMEIDRESRNALLSEGLTLYPPKRLLTVDTGKVEGVERVVQHLLRLITPDDRSLSLEGMSGVGKSTTTRLLAKALNASSISFGDLFRYLTYSRLTRDEQPPEDVLRALEYRFERGVLSLWNTETDELVTGDARLRTVEVERLLPTIAKVSQKAVIEFIQRELLRLRNVFPGRILLEGRAFTLDFLPTDVRIKLVADPLIRAQRRG